MCVFFFALQIELEAHLILQGSNSGEVFGFLGSHDVASVPPLDARARPSKPRAGWQEPADEVV
jgi:hypothetical protein